MTDKQARHHLAWMAWRFRKQGSSSFSRGQAAGIALAADDKTWGQWDRISGRLWRRAQAT